MSHADRYELLEELGAGAQGLVRLARDRRLGREVVLKVFLDIGDADARRRFSREGKMLISVSHPAVMPILDLGTLPDGSPFYAMPFDPGATTLDHWLRDGLAGPAQWLSVARDLAAGLDHIHTLSLCHRDLKPSNVLVYPPARALLLDFGLAKSLDGSSTRLTQTGAVIGTMAYLSPEQARGEPAGPRSDLYQLGLILYEMIVGARAVTDASDYLRRLSEGLRPTPPPSDRLPGIDEELEEVLLQATSFDPGDRYPTGALMIAALERVPLERWLPGTRARHDSMTQDDPVTARLEGAPDSPHGTGGTSPHGQPVPSSDSFGGRVPGVFPESGAGSFYTRKGRSEPDSPVPAVAAEAPVPAPSRSRGVLAATIGILSILALAAGLTGRRAAPSFEAPVISVTMRGLRVKILRSPPGPASLHVTRTGAATLDLADDRDGTEHLFDLVDLPDRAEIEVQPRWQEHAGPAVKWRYESFTARRITSHRAGGVLEVTFETPLPVESRFAVWTPGGWEWTDWEEAPSTRHRFERPTGGRPQSTRWRVAHRLGKEDVQQDVVLSPEERANALADLAAGLEQIVMEVTRPRQGTAGEFVELMPAVEGGRLGETFPAWIFEELGGEAGFLSGPEASPEGKDSLNRALGDLEPWIAFYDWIGESVAIPLEAAYGPDFGPSSELHYPQAHQIPVVLQGAGASLSLPTLVRGPGRTARAGDPGPARLEAAVKLGKLRPGSRVELVAELTLPPGSWIEVTVNDGRHLRLGSPRRAAKRGPRQATAFDVRYLVEGENRLVFTGATLPNMDETLLPSALEIPASSISLRLAR